MKIILRPNNIISSKGYQPPPLKVQAIRDFPKPTCVQQLRRFLGMLNFYRRCIPNAAMLQAPLHGMVRCITKGSKKPLVWTPESDLAFNRCRESTVEAVTKLPLSHGTADSSDRRFRLNYRPST